jgi:hypothetical protein
VLALDRRRSVGNTVRRTLAMSCGAKRRQLDGLVSRLHGLPVPTTSAQRLHREA